MPGTSNEGCVPKVAFGISSIPTPGTAVSRRSLICSNVSMSTTYADQICFTPDEDATIGQGQRGENIFPDRILADKFMLRSRLDDIRVALLAGQQQMPRHRHR